MSDSGVVVLLSGGLDSAALASSYASASALVACLFVDYGQPAARQEHAAAQTIARQLDVPLHVVPCPLMGLSAMREGSPGDPCVVPVRNLVLMAIAVNYAVSIGASEIALGATRDDQVDYIDCRQSYVDVVNDLARLHGVRIVYPFVQLSRPAVLEIALRTGVDLEVTWSCYTPTTKGACGECASCIARRAVMA